MSSRLISVLTPMVMVATTMRPTTMPPWTTSVRKEILKPPRAFQASQHQHLCSHAMSDW
jgi:hypothetical protein